MKNNLLILERYYVAGSHNCFSLQWSVRIFQGLNYLRLFEFKLLLIKENRDLIVLYKVTS